MGDGVGLVGERGVMWWLLIKLVFDNKININYNNTID
jgi:hypothetical protein